jgi:hypothetical protein
LVQQQELAAGIDLAISGPKPVWGKAPAVEVKPMSKIMAESIVDPIRESSSTSSGSSGKKGKKM